jgi:site-specific DNA recombinase
MCSSPKHLGQQITRLDEYVLGELARRLSADDAAGLLAGEDQPDMTPLREEAAILRTRLDDIAAEWADPSSSMNRRQFQLASAKITARLGEITEQMTSSEHAEVLDGVIKPGDPDAVLAALKDMDISRQQAILGTVADVTIHPVGRGRKTRDSAEVTFRR